MGPKSQRTPIPGYLEPENSALGIVRNCLLGRCIYTIVKVIEIMRGDESKYSPWYQMQTQLGCNSYYHRHCPDGKRHICEAYAKWTQFIKLFVHIDTDKNIKGEMKRFLYSALLYIDNDDRIGREDQQVLETREKHLCLPNSQCHG